MSNLTITIPDDLRKQLEELSLRNGKPVSEIVTDSVERYLAVKQFQELRGRIQGAAAESGYDTDEDVFRTVS